MRTSRRRFLYVPVVTGAGLEKLDATANAHVATVLPSI
jgi:hypothetical protein